MGANEEVARPGVAHAADGVVNDGDVVAAAHPLFADDIGLFEEDDGLAGAAIAQRPLLQPERDRGIAFLDGAVIWDDGIGGSVQFYDGDGAGGIAAAGDGRVGAGDGGKGGEAVGQFAGQHIRHAAPVGEAGGVNAQRIDAPELLQVGEQITDEKHIVCVRIAARAGIPTREVVWPDSALGIGHDHIIAVGQHREARAVLLLQGSAAMSMKIEDKRLLNRISVSPRNMQQIRAVDTAGGKHLLYAIAGRDHRWFSTARAFYGQRGQHMLFCG